MKPQVVLPQPATHQTIIETLEQEIARLENQLNGIENELNTFQSHIWTHLNTQIIRVRELTEVYKKVQRAKKDKRQEQKKKGKNYQEPQGIKTQGSLEQETAPKLTANHMQERKRLYKEAVVLVHPDKFPHEQEKLERANELTVQLNELYEQGDLEELKDFYEHILSGNAMSHIPFQTESIADPEAMIVFLNKKKDELKDLIAQAQESHLYLVLRTYSKPLTFIEELRIQFEERIKQLEKRTRKAKKMGI